MLFTQTLVARYFFSFVLAFMVTFGLFFMMQWLIASGDMELEDASKRIRVELGSVREVEETRLNERKPEEALPEPAPITEIRMTYDTVNVSDPVSFTSNNLDEGNMDQGFGISFVADGEYLPIVRVAPQYPARAAERGLEGYVIVVFTVTPNGSTTNVRIVESSDKVFERNAIRAAERFKYKPKVVDGEPVSVDGVRTEITFVLEDER